MIQAWRVSLEVLATATATVKLETLALATYMAHISSAVARAWRLLR
ncbi:hypothetical protein ALP48_102267 [Pseudomonas syringae pv. solidagae]|uniref:Uncharacterized protein n=1 Tax=Pseudomonas syringae pv. solidagae TaxID=264458 RepID=A0A3M5LMV7_PSESX|nr:hypothetical protein ALP48_102267 [Pseudomonas syringae pv. solidagae]